MHAAFKVAVAADHRCGHQVGLADRLGHRVRQRPGIADAGGAAVTGQGEAQLVQRLVQAGLLQIVGNHLRTRRQRGLDPRTHLKPARHGLLGNKPGTDHHIGIGGVGTRRDRRDHHIAMADGMLAAFQLGALVGGVFLLPGVHQVFGEVVRDPRQRHPVLRPHRAGHAGLDRGHVQRQRVGEDRIGRLLGAPQALGLGILLHQRHARRLAGGVLEELHRFRIDREEAAGGAIFRRHVGERRAVFQAQLVQAGAVIFHELAHHALLAQHLGGGQHQVGGGDAFAQLAGQLEADHFGNEHRDGLAQHGGFRLDAAHAPAQHSKAVDHGGVAVGAHHAVGEGDLDGLLVDAVLLLPDPHRLGQVFQVHLVADAGARRHDAEVRKGLLAPAQELVALLVAFIFDGHVLLERVLLAEIVDHHAVVDDQIDFRQRIDLFRVAAQLLHGIAHRG